MQLIDAQNYHPPKNLLENKTILITGAGDGIGKTIAIALAEYGATIILLGKTIRKLNATYDEIIRKNAPEPAIYALNMEGASPLDYQQMADKITAEFHSLDGLIHNAATLKLLSPIQIYDAKTWYEVMQVNLNAPFLITQACLPLLKKSPQASILFTSDSVGRKGKAYWGAYGVSKFGIEGLMQTLAQELENTSIRVNSFDPGKTQTQLHKLAYPGAQADQIKKPNALISYYLWIMGEKGGKIHGEALCL